MKKTNQKYKSQKQRLNSILLALIWGATIMTGCKMAVSSNGGPMQEGGEVTTISIPEGATLALKIKKIEEFITANKDSESLAKDIRKIMVALTEEREGGPFIDRLTNLSNIIPNLISPKDLETIDLENKRSDDNYSNYTDYENEYKTAENLIEFYERYYNDDYIISYNAYKKSYDNYLEPINKLERVLNYLIDDFNDDNIFNFTAKESDKKEKPEYYKVDNLEYYKVDNLETILANAENPNSDLKKNLEDKTEDLGKKEYDLNIKLENADTYAKKVNAFVLENKSAISFTYGANINDFLSKIDETTKTIDFIIPSGPLSISSVNEEAGTAEETPKIISDITKIKEKMQKENKDATFSLSYENLDETDVSINMDISVYDSEKDTIHEILNDLPKLDFKLVDVTGNGLPYADGNLYDKGIDTLIAKYYNADAQDKLSLDLGVEATVYYFDAKEALNGKTMYTENDYNGNAYDLDINAALLMGVPVKNVEITGTDKTDKTKMPRVTNVRVSADVSDIIFGAGSGVVDFVNNAPIDTPDASKGKVIIRSVGDNDTFLKYAASLDLSLLDSQQINKLNTNLKQREIKLKDMDSYNVYSVKNFTEHPGVVYVNNQVQFGDNSRGFNATNADWEQAGNDGTLPPENTANVSQANVKSVKSLVMKRLLDDNQRVYG